MRRYAETITNVLIFLFIVGVSLKRNLLIRSTMDIALTDESRYLKEALKFNASHVLPPLKGFLYTLWCAGTSRFFQDMLSFHYWNYRLLAVLAALNFYYLLRGIRVQRFVALAVTFLYVFMDCGRGASFTFVNFFAVLILLVFLNIAIRLKNKENVVFVMALGALAASFVRPEYLLSFYFILGYLAIKFLLFHRTDREMRKKLLGLGLVFAAVISTLGNPSLSKKSEWMIFGNNFSIAAVKRYHDPIIHPVLEWRRVTETKFPKANSIVSAAISNPREFKAHIFYNVKNYFRCLRFGFGVWWIEAGFFLVAGLGLMRFLKGTGSSSYNREWVFVATALLFSPVLSVIVLSVIGRYLTLQTLCLFALFGVGINKMFKVEFHGVLIVILGVAVLIAMPTDGGDFYSKNPRNLSRTKMIFYLRSLRTSEEPRLLCDSVFPASPLGIYVNRPVTLINPYAKRESFLEFLEKKKINLIMISYAGWSFVNNHLYVEDKEFKDFIAAPENYGFAKSFSNAHHIFTKRGV